MVKINRQLLERLGNEGLEKKLAGEAEEKIESYRERFQIELNLISDLNYVDYFLIIWDIMRFARESGIMYSPGRGSVGGSLLAYLIDITQVDPIKFDLIFERFMNPVRSASDPPDIDLDFQASRRHEVKEYILEKYGADRVCSIGTHSYAYASNTIKDVAKVMGLDYQELNKVIAHKMYDKTLKEGYENVEGFKKWVDSTEENRECFDISCKLEGMVRYGVHAAGVIIAPKRLAGSIPTVIKDGIISTQWNMGHLKKLGFLKVDILGLSTLDVLNDTIKSLDSPLDLSNIPLDDKEVLQMFSRGETVGVFQFETNHLQSITKKLGVDGFHDLVVATTICRPGSTDSGITESYIKRKHGKEEVTYTHESLKEILQDTMGHPFIKS